MLWLPCLIKKPQNAHRILLLGVGLGAALLKLRCYLPGAEITAVDIDPTHLSLAKKLLDEQESTTASGRDKQKASVRWVQADALQWLKTKEGRFDIIIDDLFFDKHLGQGIVEPARIIGFDEVPPQAETGANGDKSWMKCLKHSLDSDGMLIANCESHRSVSQGFKLWAARSNDVQGLALRVQHYENRVGVFGRGAAARTEFSQSAWIEHARSAILNSAWAKSIERSKSIQNRELDQLFESIKRRKLAV